MRTFWNWVQNETGRVLFINGPIAEESWYDDEVTPEQFKKDLHSGKGPVTVWINSPGGCVFSAARIYTMLRDYPGHVTVKIDGIAASAASVIAMAGNETLMSPVSYMLIHNPYTMAIGDSEEMQKTIALLDEVKEGIVNAYEAKTGLDRAEISRLMDIDSCFHAKRAVELGFADGILFTETPPQNCCGGIIFSQTATINALLNKVHKKPAGIPIDGLYKRLSLLK